MQKRTREILALLLLLILGLLAVAAMGWYILVGHNWNVAATNIDDSVGQMKGYTVLLVEGTRSMQLVTETEAAEVDATDSTSATSDPTKVVSTGAASEAGETDANAAAKAADETNTTRATSATGKTNDPAESAEMRDTGDGTAAAQTALNQAASETALQTNYSTALNKLALEYEAKGAAVAIVRNWQGGAYDEPRTVHMAGRTISLFEINYPVRPAAVRTQLKLLERRDSNFNIMLTNDLAFDERALKGVEIVIFTNPDKEYVHGHYYNGSYCVDIAPVGHAEAIIVAPSGVISSKTLELPDTLMPLGPYELIGPFVRSEPEQAAVFAESAVSTELVESAKSSASAHLAVVIEGTHT